MTTYTLYRCNDCYTVTVFRACQNSSEHALRALSETEANNYVRIGHDAFKEIPEPQPPTYRPNAKAVKAFKRAHRG